MYIFNIGVKNMFPSFSFSSLKNKRNAMPLLVQFLGGSSLLGIFGLLLTLIEIKLFTDPLIIDYLNQYSFISALFLVSLLLIQGIIIFLFLEFLKRFIIFRDF